MLGNGNDQKWMKGEWMGQVVAGDVQYLELVKMEMKMVTNSNLAFKIVV